MYLRLGRVVTGLIQQFEIFLEVEGKRILVIFDIDVGDEIKKSKLALFTSRASSTCERDLSDVI